MFKLKELRSRHFRLNLLFGHLPRASFFLQKNKQSDKDVDINQALRNLKESDVQITFKDILIDYKNYRENFFMTQVFQTPKEAHKNEEVDVDVDKFNLKTFLIWVFKNSETHPTYSFEHLFSCLCFFIAVISVWSVFRIPIDKYYDWEDPLDT